MNSFHPNGNANKINPRQVLGGAMGWPDETGYEMETPSIPSVAKGVGSIFEDIFNLGQNITGIESQNNTENSNGFPSKGSLEFNKKEATAQEKLKKKEEAERKKVFYQTLKEDQMEAQRAKEKMLFEEEISDIISSLSTEEKNKLLHYQSSYKDKSIYQIAELRRKIIEQKRKAEKEEKASSVAETKPGASALQTAFEGGSGSQGAGQANLSAHATG